MCQFEWLQLIVIFHFATYFPSIVAVAGTGYTRYWCWHLMWSTSFLCSLHTHTSFSVFCQFALGFNFFSRFSSLYSWLLFYLRTLHVFLRCNIHFTHLCYCVMSGRGYLCLLWTLLAFFELIKCCFLDYYCAMHKFNFHWNAFCIPIQSRLSCAIWLLLFLLFSLLNDLLIALILFVLFTFISNVQQRDTACVRHLYRWHYTDSYVFNLTNKL